jgi:hypothetical protein
MNQRAITDLPFKNVGQVTRFLNKQQRQIQQTMDRIEKAFPGNSVSQAQTAVLSDLTPTHLAGTTSRVADKQDQPARSLNRRSRNLGQEALDSTDDDDVLADASIPPLDPKRHDEQGMAKLPAICSRLTQPRPQPVQRRRVRKQSAKQLKRKESSVPTHRYKPLKFKVNAYRLSACRCVMIP